MEPMQWLEDLGRLCMSLDNSMEIVQERAGAKYLLVVPRMPSQDIQEKIRSIIPSEVKYEYQESPRVVTTQALKILLAEAHATSVEFHLNKHKVLLEIEGDSPMLTEKDSPAWRAIRNILIQDPFVEAFRVTVNGEIVTEFDPKISEAIKTTIKPEREIGFSTDDIMNLRIDLETCRDVEQFIAHC